DEQMRRCRSISSTAGYHRLLRGISCYRDKSPVNKELPVGAAACAASPPPNGACGWHIRCTCRAGVRGAAKSRFKRRIRRANSLPSGPCLVIRWQYWRMKMKAALGAMSVAAMLAVSASSAFAGYLQASSEEDQIVGTANKPQLVTMASTDAAKGIKNNKGVVILDQTGTYFTIVGVQVGSRGGTGLV